jgi:hypothetical protein
MDAPNVMNPKRGRTAPRYGSGSDFEKSGDAHFRVAGSELSTVTATNRAVFVEGVWKRASATAFPV